MTTIPVNNDPSLLSKDLKRFFGLDGFYTEEQETATREVLEGNKDVFISFRPGGGKSLCYQLPTMLNDFKITVVFVPTHVLAKNQIDFLKCHGIDAEYLCPRFSNDKSKKIEKALNDLKTAENQLRFVFVSLDKTTREIAKKLMLKLIKANDLGYVVLDEAHCMSNLSHHYIKDYEEVASLIKNVCANIPKIALTGTATQEVRNDIIKLLDMKNPRKFVSLSYNPNVYHEVYFTDTIQSPLDHLGFFILQQTSCLCNEPSKDEIICGIIFCRTKAATEEIAKNLRSLHVPVVTYHGDMPKKKRIEIYDKWIAGEIPVIATTRQFGIGLRRRDVAFIIHWSMPTSMQQFIQETGRVNQDGRKATCRLYFSMEEEMHITTQIKSQLSSRLKDIDVAERQRRFFHEVIDYCFQTTCRHVAQWAYFGAEVTPCQRYCDVCGDKNHQQRLNEISQLRKFIKQQMDEEVIQTDFAEFSVKNEDVDSTDISSDGEDVESTDIHSENEDVKSTDFASEKEYVKSINIPSENQDAESTDISLEKNQDAEWTDIPSEKNQDAESTDKPSENKNVISFSPIKNPSKKKHVVSTIISSRLRGELLGRLLTALRYNYHASKSNIEHKLTSMDICKIAKQVEFTIFTVTKQRRKYINDMARQINTIRSCARAKTACGHLKMYERHSMKTSAEQFQVSELMSFDEKPLEKSWVNVPVKISNSIEAAENQSAIKKFDEMDEIPERMIVDDKETVENSGYDVIEKKSRSGELLENPRPLKRFKTSSPIESMDAKVVIKMER